jgi:hypothetical protein
VRELQAVLRIRCSGFSQELAEVLLRTLRRRPHLARAVFADTVTSLSCLHARAPALALLVVHHWQALDLTLYEDLPEVLLETVRDIGSCFQLVAGARVSLEVLEVPQRAGPPPAVRLWAAEPAVKGQLVQMYNRRLLAYGDRGLGPAHLAGLSLLEPRVAVGVLRALEGRLVHGGCSQVGAPVGAMLRDMVRWELGRGGWR